MGAAFEPKRKSQMNISEPVLAAMRQTNELFEVEAIRKRNTDVLNRVYTANARILPPGAPMIEGRGQIKSFWQQAIADLGLESATLSTVDAEAVGDSVIEIGRSVLTVGRGQILTVKYVVHWKQEDGTWKWNVDIWNLNQ
jgi:ketosteroid isomerase-like protein